MAADAGLPGLGVQGVLLQPGIEPLQTGQNVRCIVPLNQCGGGVALGHAIGREHARIGRRLEPGQAQVLHHIGHQAADGQGQLGLGGVPMGFGDHLVCPAWLCD